MQKITGPNPNIIYPLKDYNKIIFLKNFVKSPNIIVGDYTYFDDRRNGPEKFEEYNVLYNYDFSKVKLIIGKFCAIAAETRFIMTGNHKLDAISTYPFPIFQEGWESAYNIFDLPVRGDIVVGHDVWFGYDSLIMPGIKIGHGSIIATRAVVVKDVPPYSIVAGNPGKVVKKRFDDATIDRLLQIAWWDWNIEKINRNLPLICNLDIDALENAE
ncbi:MAG: CatB-related O-acetyltransferase [Parachlamydiaceae bacterium]|nr:CatB-related O-acetyltransferase [Parachlamydiaceae bacterium]